jgi:hypothetical protein
MNSRSELASFARMALIFSMRCRFFSKTFAASVVMQFWLETGEYVWLLFLSCVYCLVSTAYSVLTAAYVIAISFVPDIYPFYIYIAN